MKIAIVAVPYDSGRRGVRMGAGPLRLLDSGLADALTAAGHDVAINFIETEATEEKSAAFDLARRVQASVSSALQNDRFPLVLAGNCMASLGALAALPPALSLLWLDAHADFNTPDTSSSGFIDGMALSVMTGRCFHDDVARQLPSYTPIDDARVFMLGVRDIDEGERAALQRVTTIRSSRELWPALATARDLYLHFDLDALDPSVLRANHFAAAHGLSLHTVDDVIATIRANCRLRGMAFTAYDPAADMEDAGPAIVARVITSLLEPTG